MKFVSFHDGGHRPRLGAMLGDETADLTAAGLGDDLIALIRGGAAALAAAQAAAAAAPRLARSAVRLGPPLRPGKVLCSGINYKSLLDEVGMSAPPAEPFFFAKLPSSIVGADDPVAKPARTAQMDWEVEFAAVIGAPLYLCSEAEVMPAIFGYTLLNDLSGRDVQLKDAQITLGKNFKGFAPIGPCVVTADEMPDLSDIRVTTHVNGILRQDDSSRNWLFSLPRLVSFIAQVMPLEPGDIVTTGTPAGLGMNLKPPVWLAPGDVVTIAATGIGELSTRIVAP